MTEEITREPVAQSLDALCGFLSLRRINVYDVDGAIAYDEPDPECTAAALRLRVQSADIERLQGALKSALAFIDRVEGHGYGGEADHMVAQILARDALTKTGAPQ